MLMSWMKRRRRGQLAWLGRIDGVEKPALLLGLGLVLYRAWRSGDNGNAPTPALKDRWRTLVDRVRRKIHDHQLDRTTDGQDAPPASAPI
jgi:hypothetical protein